MGTADNLRMQEECFHERVIRPILDQMNRVMLLWEVCPMCGIISAPCDHDLHQEWE